MYLDTPKHSEGGELFIERDDEWAFLPAIGMQIAYFAWIQSYQITIKSLRYDVVVATDLDYERAELIISCGNFQWRTGRALAYEATPYDVTYDTDQLVEILEATGWRIMSRSQREDQDKALLRLQQRTERDPDESLALNVLRDVQHFSHGQLSALRSHIDNLLRDREKE